MDVGRGPEKKEEEELEQELSPFYGIDKGQVLQEARIFHEAQLDVKRCSQVLTKLLYLVNQGDSLTSKEASDVFFAMTKLFQSKDSHLRRLTYLALKDVSPGSDEVIIIISSLMKDMNSQNELFKANALRVLSGIVDSQLLLQIERYLKQAIVDKSPTVASAALVSGIHLLRTSPDVIKRWASEVQDATGSKFPMVQFHAVALVHATKAGDRQAITKLVTNLVRTGAKSPMAQALLVRYVAQVIADSTPESRPFYDFLESCLRHKAELVIFEAARAIVGMRDVALRELQPAITVLQLFLSSSKPVMRFAALRTLNKVAQTYPLAVANCNIDLETLISDPNRSIATLAITTLLKTGNESSIERLLKQIGGFMGDIADEFKMQVVDAIRTLCVKFPQKHRQMLHFLSSNLREEGGFDYKKAIVDAILTMVQQIPDAKELALSHLCEFIEDCEYTYLAAQILYLLGSEGPKTKDPSKYVRFMYNRIILENATIRAAAVSAMARLGAGSEALRPGICVLLRRALQDADDEVRDRAVYHLNLLGGRPVKLEVPDIPSGIPCPPQNLEEALTAYLAAGRFDQPFNIYAVSTAAVAKPTGAAAKRAQAVAAQAAAAAQAAEEKTKGVDYTAILGAIPGLAALGPPLLSSAAQSLTEEGTEYVISVVKHIFAQHVVLQFSAKNTVAEQLVEDLTVSLDLSEVEGLTAVLNVPLARMPNDKPGNAFVVLERPGGGVAVGRVGCTLQYRIREVDPSTGEPEEEGYPDEYQLEDFEIGHKDYVKPVNVGNWRHFWDSLPAGTERADDYGLGPREKLEEAVEATVGALGMTFCEGTDVVPPNSRSHTALLSGAVLGSAKVLARIQFGMDASRNVAMKVISRGETDEISELVHNIIQSS